MGIVLLVRAHPPAKSAGRMGQPLIEGCQLRKCLDKSATDTSEPFSPRAEISFGLRTVRNCPSAEVVERRRTPATDHRECTR